MSDLIVVAPAAGWYPDPIADGQLRWWNGEGWTERTMAPPPEAQVFAPATPVAYTEVDYAAARQAYEPEPEAAAGLAWQQTPLVSRDSALGYTAVVERAVQWRPSRTMTSGAAGLAFLPWTSALLLMTGGFAMGYAPVAPYVPAAIGLIILLLSIALAQRDRRRLRELGHAHLASEWWVLLLPPLAYLIARTVATHRSSGKGMAALMLYLVNCVLVVTAGLGVAIFLPVLLGSAV